MAFITAVRNRKWFVTTFALSFLAIFIISIIIGLIQTFEKTEKYIGVVHQNITQEQYSSYLKKAKKDPFSKNPHQKAWYNLKKEMCIEEICKSMGITISDDRIKSEIASYSENIQEFMRRNYFSVDKEIKDGNITFQQFKDDFTKKYGDFFQINKKEIKKIIAEAEVAHYIVNTNNTPKNPTQKINVTYGILPYSQLKTPDEKDSIPTQEEIQELLNQEKNKKNQNFRKIHYTIIRKYYPYQNIQNTIEELNNLKKEWIANPDKNTLESFISKNSDNDTTTITWSKENAPIYIQQLPKNTTSDVIKIDINRYAIYKIKEKTTETITAWQIVKKVDPEQETTLKEKAEKIEKILKQNQKKLKTTTEKTIIDNIKKKIPLTTTSITKKQANKLGSSYYVDQIAKHIYQKNLLPYSTFCFNPKDTNYYLIGYVENTYNNHKYQDIEDKIIKKHNQNQKLHKLKTFLQTCIQNNDDNFQQTKNNFINKYGYIEFKTAHNRTTRETSLREEEIDSPEDIITIIINNKKTHAFINPKNEDEVIITFIEHNNNETSTATTEQQNPYEKINTYFNQYENPNIQDQRYKYSPK